MLKQRTSGEIISLAGTPAPAAQAVAPTEIRVFKSGKVDTTKGVFLFDAKAAASVMKAWTSYGNDLSFDYEHKMVDPEARAGDGKAAGWFQLEVRPDGLYAVNIKWTAQAADQIAKKEWRYFSPTFDFDKKTGRILELVNVALTNIPATKNLPALVAAHKDSTAMAVLKKKALAAKTATADKDQEMLGSKKTKKVTETMEESDDADLDGDDGDAATDDADLADDDDAASTDDADLDDSDDATMDDADTDDADLADDDDADSAPAAAPPFKKKSGKKTARSSLSTNDREYLAASKILLGGTGREALGKLAGLLESHKQVESLSQEVAQIRLSTARAEVKALVERAITSGRIAPASRDSFVKLGLKMGKPYLLGMLKTMAPKVHMVSAPESAGHKEAVIPGVKGAPTELDAVGRKIARKFGIENEMAELAKGGKLISLAQFMNPDEEEEAV